jgi:hypothetical protein
MTLDVFQLPGPGAEDVVVAGSGRDEGSVFTGTADGALWRIRHEGSQIDRVAHTGGRPLGIEVGADVACSCAMPPGPAARRTRDRRHRADHGPG